MHTIFYLQARRHYYADKATLSHSAQPDKNMISRTEFCKNTDFDKIQNKQRVHMTLFKNLKKANLPAAYRSNTKCWMADAIFKEWFYNLDQIMKNNVRS